jgi:hypothetical protein
VERVKEEQSERRGKREQKRKRGRPRRGRRPRKRRPRRGGQEEAKEEMRERVCVDKGEKGEQILGLLCANREGERERQDTRRRLSRFPFPISSFYSSPNGLGQRKNAQKPKSQERKTEPKKAGRPSNKACVTRGGDRRNISI